MVPVLTPEEMTALDTSSSDALEVLVARAGAAVAREALGMMGGAYGRRVVVVAGKGNNGADGRNAARRLTMRGARVVVIEATDDGLRLPPCDLVIDSAYGTGFRGDYLAPGVSGRPMRGESPPAAAGRRTRGVTGANTGFTPVLAVDIPSGVDGLTGEASAHAVRADRTVTFAALKPGLLLGGGAQLTGTVVVADIGLDAAKASTAGLVEAADVAGWLPARPHETHKWKSAIWVVAGSPGMTGAAQLCATAALRIGAGTVRLGVPGTEAASLPSAPEVVGRNLPAENWDKAVADDLDRARALVVGPGLGRTSTVSAAVRRLLCLAPEIPVVVDADALWALGEVDEAASVLAHRKAPTILTPHEGEFTRMTGAPVPADRLSAVRDLAARVGATVMLKGSTTIAADPSGRAMFITEGDSRLATAGTGDVLAGMAGALLAMGSAPLETAAAAAFVHGRAARLGFERGLVAGDLPPLIPQALAAL